MRVLILGSGGREHALAWGLSKSPLLSELYAAPGNAGISELAECVALDILDADAVVGWSKAQRIDLVVIGPEAPLAAGIADAVTAAGIDAFGPSAAAATLEASKAFTHEVCDACNAPMAGYATFSDAAEAKAHIRATDAPIVIKADGLAAGKGVVIAETIAEAEAAIDEMLGGLFGAASTSIVIEEFMVGEEASFFALSDGNTVRPLTTAQDHKRAFDGDLGPNTGGMGAYSPAPVITADVEKQVMEQIIEPVIAEMAQRGTPYQGILYAGLMIQSGKPRLIEFNVRFGDPECQALMLRLDADLLALLVACANGTLASCPVKWRREPAITVVMAAKGYPGPYAKGDAINGLAEAADVDGVTIFHAGTTEREGQIMASGGRVLNVSATGATLAEARDRVYRAIATIDWPGGVCRTDIGWRELRR